MFRLVIITLILQHCTVRLKVVICESEIITGHYYVTKLPGDGIVPTVYATHHPATPTDVKCVAIRVEHARIESADAGWPAHVFQYDLRDAWCIPTDSIRDTGRRQEDPATFAGCDPLPEGEARHSLLIRSPDNGRLRESFDNGPVLRCWVDGSGNA